MQTETYFFYADGHRSVFGKNHAVLPNGNGNVFMQNSVTQGGLFIPKPGNLNIMYFFYIGLPVSNSFSISYNFIAGKVYGEETRGTDNLNFKSSLVGQSLMLEYNFQNIINPDADKKFSVLPASVVVVVLQLTMSVKPDKVPPSTTVLVEEQMPPFCSI